MLWRLSWTVKRATGQETTCQRASTLPSGDLEDHPRPVPLCVAWRGMGTEIQAVFSLNLACFFPFPKLTVRIPSF